jgi:excisionase family DNA binding protein
MTPGRAVAGVVRAGPDASPAFSANTENGPLDVLTFELPPAAVEAIARRAAEIVLDEQQTVEVEAASPYLTIREAATYLRCPRQRIDDLLSARRLTRIKEGARTLVSRDEIEAYLVRRPRRDR